MKKPIVITLLIAIYGFLGGFLYFFVINPQKPKVTPQVQAQEVTLSSDGLWNTIQNWRKSQGIKQYIKSEKLCEIAEFRSKEIVQHYNHEGFPKVVRTYCGDKCNVEYSENIAQGPINDLECLNGWLNSPPHAAALHKNYTYSCVAVNGIYAVQIFSY